jgi:hypothetical protein
MKKLRQLLLSLAVLAPLVMSSGALAAWNPLQGIDCTGTASKSAVCQDASHPRTNPLVGPDGLLVKIANVIAVIAGIAAVIIIILAGLRLVTSGGNTDDAVGARRAVIYAAVGLIVIALARAIIILILSRL